MPDRPFLYTRRMMLSLCAATALAFSPTIQPMALAATMRVRPVSMADLPFGMGGDKADANAATAAAIDIAEIEAPTAPATPSSGAAADLSVTFSDVELAEQEAKLQALSDKWKKREEEVPSCCMKNCRAKQPICSPCCLRLRFVSLVLYGTSQRGAPPLCSSYQIAGRLPGFDPFRLRPVARGDQRALGDVLHPGRFDH